MTPISRTRHLRSYTLGLTGAALIAGAAIWLPSVASRAAESPVNVPAPTLDETAAGTTETAILAGGCFWGVQGVFQHVKGVKNAVSGYAGSPHDVAAPTYEQVSSGTTGEAESVKITFDPQQISYGRILQIYFSVVQDPTELNRQGPDTGTQYRSIIMTTSPTQARIAKAYIGQLDAAKVFPKAIVTTVQASKHFHEAEAYHQNFATLHPNNPYISYNDLPKIANLSKMYPTLYRAKPVLVATETAMN